MSDFFVIENAVKTLRRECYSPQYRYSHGTKTAFFAIFNKLNINNIALRKIAAASPSLSAKMLQRAKIQCVAAFLQSDRDSNGTMFNIILSNAKNIERIKKYV